MFHSYSCYEISLSRQMNYSTLSGMQGSKSRILEPGTLKRRPSLQSPSLSSNQLARSGKFLHEISWYVEWRTHGGSHIDALLSNTKLLREKQVRLWFLEPSHFTLIISFILSYIILHLIVYSIVFLTLKPSASFTLLISNEIKSSNFLAQILITSLGISNRCKGEKKGR